MLLSVISKKNASSVAREFMKVATTRSFTSSSSSSSSSQSSWNGYSKSGSKDYSTASSPSATASAASLNYDSALTSVTHYNIAVAFQPKDRAESNTFKKKQRSPSLDSPSGEDNLFVSNEVAGAIAVGVADGVGGWSEAGYDSSAISRELCASIKRQFELGKGETPKELLSLAFKDVLASPKVEIGGTTACLGVLTPDLKLHVANLGDSWCGLFRDSKLINETNFQTHNFNTPFQLAKIPKEVVRQAELQGRRYIIDSPSSADEYTWDLHSGDIVMFATDGVTDNVIPQDMELFLKENENNTKLDDVATRFVKEVVKVSKDSNFPSAFAQELSRLTGQKYLGGKEDDITVVLIKVK
ncbi:Protein phosphatase 2C 7, mitochondrial [Candida viswanathii]|uniref:Protein phosphatase n=1 Tax=Candida viswanathii TaxID=5486 RepID=A0A367Y280_9ASCO|nr:Protein phosphatase 2C 7, mitochondrial [Candida viswanathii]